MAPPTPAETQVIDRDCLCSTCHYNLRTCSPAGRCPECATPVLDSLRAHAQSVVVTDPRWLRALTNGLLWLILAMLFPCLFLVVPISERSLGSWLTFNRLRLTLVMIPAILAIAACWRMGAAARPIYRGDGDDNDDQPVTRWLLRCIALVWLLPLFIIAGPFDNPDFDRQPYELLLLLLGWTSLIATLLFFRRLKYVARKIRSRSLLVQCNIIGSQWPVATVLLAITMGSRISFQYEPSALVYAAVTPLPAAGLPWLLVENAERLRWLNWNYLQNSPEVLLQAWPVLFQIATFILAVEFLIILIRVRRRHLSDRDLPAYCRDLVQKFEDHSTPAALP